MAATLLVPGSLVTAGVERAFTQNMALVSNSSIAGCSTTTTHYLFSLQVMMAQASDRSPLWVHQRPPRTC